MCTTLFNNKGSAFYHNMRLVKQNRWGNAVAQLVEELHYKPEDRGLDFPLGY
jgi:hypothetical protein